jgi:hypothetical protein
MMIVLRRGGVFPLFYEAVTGRSLGTRAITLKVREFLPFVTGVGHEYGLATGQLPPLCGISFGLVVNNGVQHAQAIIASRVPYSSAELTPFLRGYNAVPGSPRTFIGPQIQNVLAPWSELRASLNTYLLYRIDEKTTYSALTTNKKLQCPQELPIALLFFYMSSVVRYRPEFFARLRDSKYWPVISSARVHAFLDFLFVFWCYVQKRNYYIKR